MVKKKEKEKERKMKSLTGYYSLEDLFKGLYALLLLPLFYTLYSVLLFIIQRCFYIDLYKTNYSYTFR
jgi:hypothetical protein